MSEYILCKKHKKEVTRFGDPFIFIPRIGIEWIELFNSNKELVYRKNGTLLTSDSVEGYTVKVEGKLPVHIMKNLEIDEEYEKRKE